MKIKTKRARAEGERAQDREEKPERKIERKKSESGRDTIREGKSIQTMLPYTRYDTMRT